MNMLLSLLLGCQNVTTELAPPVEEPVLQQPAAPPPPAVDPDDVIVEIVDRSILAALEAEGLSLAALLGADTPPEVPTTAWMAEALPRYRALAEGWGSEAEALASRIKRDMVVDHREAVRWPASNVARRLDPRWFASETSFFQLIGIINRLDRRELIGGCGEVRLLYRLAYQAQTESGMVGSRLPVTVNVVLSQPPEDCLAVARGWSMPTDDLAGALQTLTLKQIELNAQIVRFPSGVETTFAGQALYLLKVYVPDGETMRAHTLENTPDVERIAADPVLQAELRAFINDNLDDIGNGVHQLPASLLATTALSWSTLGINRTANKPFDALLSTADLPPQLPDTLGSGAELIERLNTGTCMGCHQAASTAGFHFLGSDDPSVSGITNRLQLPFSNHYHRERTRRRAYVADAASGRSPTRYRPHPLAPSPESITPTVFPDVGSNVTCVPEDRRDDVAHPWGCANAGEICQVVTASDAVLPFGQCIPESEAGLSAGMTCRAGTITDAERSDTPFNLHAYDDRFREAQIYDLPEDKRFATDSHNCRPTVIGVPLGRTFRRCTSAERALEGAEQADEICAVVGGSRFDQCVEGDFHSCLDGIVGRGMVDTCHLGRFCREDYICQSMPHQLSSVPDEAGADLVAAGVGFCTPTYFLFQLRLDGHPAP